MMNISDIAVKYITDENGDKSAVILSISEFENLLEDLKDLAIVAERRDEEIVSHDDVVKKLKQNGKL